MEMIIWKKLFLWQILDALAITSSSFALMISGGFRVGLLLFGGWRGVSALFVGGSCCGCGSASSGFGAKTWRLKEAKSKEATGEQKRERERRTKKDKEHKFY